MLHAIDMLRHCDLGATVSGKGLDEGIATIRGD